MNDEPRGQETAERGQKTEGKAVLRDPSSVLCLPPSATYPPIFGMTGHFPPGGQRRVEAGVRALTSLKVHHIRIERAWADWHETAVREWHQRLMESLSQQFAVLPALVYAPPSVGTGAPLPIPPENPKAFADFLDAMLVARERLQAVAGKAFNLGGGPDNTVSLLEVIEQLSDLSGVQPEIRYGPRRKGDQPYYVSDIRRFSQATGWTPQVSARRGVPRLYHWILENVQPDVLQPKE